MRPAVEWEPVPVPRQEPVSMRAPGQPAAPVPAGLGAAEPWERDEGAVPLLAAS